MRTARATRFRPGYRGGSVLIYLLRGDRRADELDEAARFEARAANESTVDVFLREQFGCVGRLHRAAVKNPYLLPDGVREKFREQSADERVYFLRLLGRRDFAR